MKDLLLLLLLSLTAACQRQPQTLQDGRRLVWSDEFDTDGKPDPQRWGYDLGGHGWGNNELQYYTDTPANARVEDGHLIIEAHRQATGNRAYSSARLVTRNLAEWNRGRIEVRAKLPSGRGTWPAIWMLGNNIDAVGWPACGEIDIMEHVGYEPDSIYGTIHSAAFNHVEGTQRSGAVACTDAEQEFHVYAIDWTAERIDFLLDGRIYHTFRKPPDAGRAEWPFDQPHYLLLNLAAGGNWGGKHGVDTTIWPQRMLVDYVRVYQHTTTR